MNEYRCFIDTNIFLRVLTQDEEKTFKDCTQFLARVREGKIRAITSPIVLAEVLWVLLRFYHFPKVKAIQGLRSILQLKHLEITNDSQLFLAVELYERYPVKFIDALIVSTPLVSAREVIVVSYDKDFDKLGVLRKEPKEIVKNL